MEAKIIEKLLDKYWEGETTLAEERQLKDFFQQKEIPAHLKVYLPLFVVWGKEKELPSSELDKKIMHHLKTEITDLKDDKNPHLSVQKGDSARKPLIYWLSGVAASIVLFLGGYYAGKMAGTEKEPALGAIIQELKTTRQMVMLSLLRQDSPSERIQGVNYVYQMKEETTPKVIEALFKTLNEDENTNVRMAAANALFVFREEPKVREGLIGAFEKQTDESIQITLINMLIALKDRKAIQPIREFLEEKPIPEKVKQKIEEQLQTL